MLIVLHVSSQDDEPHACAIRSGSARSVAGHGLGKLLRRLVCFLQTNVSNTTFRYRKKRAKDLAIAGTRKIYTFPILKHQTKETVRCGSDC